MRELGAAGVGVGVHSSSTHRRGPAGVMVVWWYVARSAARRDRGCIHADAVLVYVFGILGYSPGGVPGHTVITGPDHVARWCCYTAPVGWLLPFCRLKERLPNFASHIMFNLLRSRSLTGLPCQSAARCGLRLGGCHNNKGWICTVLHKGSWGSSKAAQCVRGICFAGCGFLRQRASWHPTAPSWLLVLHRVFVSVWWPVMAWKVWGGLQAASPSVKVGVCH